MNNVAKRIKIDLYSPTSYEVIKAQQGDNNSRVIEFELYDQEKPYTISNNIFITMEGHRGDNSYFQPKDCTVTDNIISVTLDSDVLYESGTVEAKIVMYNKSDNSILSTIPFKIHVQKNPCDKNKIESEKSSVIDWLVLNLNKLKTSFEEQASDLKSHLEDNVHHITASERANWDDAHNKSHKHSNLPILNKITQSLLDNWNAAYTHISDAVKHITSSERTLWNTVSNKVDKIEGKGLSTNDYTDADKNIVASMSSGAVTGIKGNEESTYRTGNVNITPANIGAVSKSGDTISGALTPAGGIPYVGKDANTYIAYTNDGEYRTRTGVVTGCIAITLPVSWTSTMIKFSATIYDWMTGESYEYIISGYNNGQSGTIPAWQKYSAICVGNANQEKANLTVRFGHNGDKCVVTIGETNTQWNYPQVQVHDIMVAYNGSAYATWHSGWNINVETTLPSTVSRTITNTNASYGGVAASCTGNAATATKAIQDSDGNNIVNTYWNKDRDIITTKILTLNKMTLSGNYDGYTTGTVSALTNYTPIFAVARASNSSDVAWMSCYLNGTTTVSAGLKNTSSVSKTFSPDVTVVYLRTS